MAATAPLPFLAPTRRADVFARTVPAGLLPGLIVAWLGGDMVLLWRFLGFGGAGLIAAGAFATGGIAWRFARAAADRRRGPSLGTIAACLGIALVLLLLGGEGRVFYANLDWQVRDAVLRDMIVHPWPFVYGGGAAPMLLRAPIGMYLVPALAGKLWGQHGADLALLAQNTLLVGALLAIAATLFEGTRARAIAGIVFLAFSGADVIGMLLVRGPGSLHATAHLEAYLGFQFSSTVTLAFWVPNHAIAGWVGALALLLWREGRLRIGAVAALLPLGALWSPLAMIGIVPFLLWAALVELRRGGIARNDVLLAAAATLFALPVLAYLAAAPDAVGAHLGHYPFAQWLAFELIDAVPLLAIAAKAPRARFSGAMLAIGAAWLAVLPWLEIGWSNDLEMRASIAPLALLAAHLADMMAGERPDAQVSGRTRALLAALLLVGAATPATEIARALELPTSPEPRCGFAKAWDLTFDTFPKGSYLAPLAKVPAWLRPAAPFVSHDVDPASCYDRPWPVRPA